MEKLHIDKKYLFLMIMLFIGVLLSILFINIFNRLFAIPTWQYIREIVEIFF
jgi:uncharacterized membrane protein YjfL (UPF0719 family)